MAMTPTRRPGPEVAEVGVALRRQPDAIRDIADDREACYPSRHRERRRHSRYRCAAGAGEKTKPGFGERRFGRSEDIEQPNTSRRAHTRSLADTIGDVASAVNTATQRGEKTFQKLSTSGPTDTATTYSFATAPIDTARTAVTPFSAASAPAAAQQSQRTRTSVVTIVTDLLGSVLHPLLYPGTGSPPLQAPTLMAILAAVRDEIERILLPRPTPWCTHRLPVSPTYPDPPADPTKQHVLVIAIDGTNMSKVLADGEQ